MAGYGSAAATTTASGGVVLGAGRRGSGGPRPSGGGGSGLIDFDRPVTPGQRSAPVSLDAVGEAPTLSRMSSIGDSRSVADILQSVRGGGQERQPLAPRRAMASPGKQQKAPLGSNPTGAAARGRLSSPESAFGGGGGGGGPGPGGWGGNPLVGPGVAVPVVVTGQVIDNELDAIDVASRYAGRTAVGSVAHVQPMAKEPMPGTEEGYPPHKRTGGGGGGTAGPTVVMADAIADPWGDVGGNAGERVSMVQGTVQDGLERNTLHEMSFHGETLWEDETYACRCCGRKTSGKKLVVLGMCCCACLTFGIFVAVLFGGVEWPGENPLDDLTGDGDNADTPVRSESWLEGQNCIGNWGDWGACSARCRAVGEADYPSQTRTYQVAQAAGLGGLDCVTADAEDDSRLCNTASCGQWADCVGAWSAYSSCTATCLSDGTRTREYSVSQAAQNGGRACTVDDGEQISESCSAGCPVDCLGQWSSWDSCTVACGGGGTQARTYTVIQGAEYSGGACAAQNAEQQWQSCNDMACNAVSNCVGRWESWSACSELCGGGQQSRIFSVSQNARNGGTACAVSHGDAELTTCNTDACPINCDGAWSSWGTCDAPCAGGASPNGGAQTRRFDIMVAADFGGIGCAAGNGEIESQACNTAGCADRADCIGRWGGWSSCTEICGGGTQSRSYSQSQASRNGGARCLAISGASESRACNDQACPAVVFSSFEFTAAVTEEEVQLAVAAASGVDLNSVQITELYPAVESQITVTGASDMFSDAALGLFAEGIASALGVTPADVEVAGVEAAGRRRYLQQVQDLLLGFTVKATGGASQLSSSITSPNFLTSVVSGVSTAAASAGQSLVLDVSQMSPPTAPTTKTVVKFEVTVEASTGTDVDSVFTSLSPSNAAALAAFIPGVDESDMVVKRPSTDVADGACSQLPCMNGAPCFGGVHVFMCGNPLSAMMVLSARCQRMQNNVCVRYAPIGADFNDQFCQELSLMIGIPAYRCVVTGTQIDANGEVEVQFDILPVASSFVENDVLDPNDDMGQEDAISLIENLQICGATTCPDAGTGTGTGTDPNLGAPGPPPDQGITVGGLGLLDVEVVDDGSFIGCPPGFDAVTCGEDEDECASSPCRNGAPCNSETIAAFDMYMCGAPVLIDVDLGPLCFDPFASACVPGQSGCAGSTLARLPSGFEQTIVEELANRSAVPIHRLNVQNTTVDAEGWKLIMEVLPAASSTPGDVLPQLQAASQIQNALVAQPVNAAGVCLQVQNVVVPPATIGCPPGFSGTNCERVEGGCLSQYRRPCINTGVCMESGADPSVGLAPEVRCDCPFGFLGDYCEVAPDGCASEPCHNGGVCHRNSTSTQFRCDCPQGWTGLTCSEWSNPCTNATVCHGKSACVHTGPNAYECRDQPVLFSYVHYHTRPSTHTIVPGETFETAYAAYLQAPAASRGYCAALLTDTTKLRNQDVCPGGTANDIAFFYSFTMTVGFAGVYSFRMHVDWGSGGGFVCFDQTCQHHAGDVWGHIYFQAPLLRGVTKVRMLGFENCCDGHAELEFQLPQECAAHAVAPTCADANAGDHEQWLNVDSTAMYECPGDGLASSLECPATGWQYYRFRPIYDANQEDDYASVEMSLFEDGVEIPSQPQFGRFAPINRTMNAEAARLYCQGHYSGGGLASIHTKAEQGLAAAACQLLADPTESSPYGCWIGLQDGNTEGEFSWLDGSPVDFLNWSPGEPNDVDVDHDSVELDFRPRIGRYGEWNDATRNTVYDYRMYPLCETGPPPTVNRNASLSWTVGTDLNVRPRRRHDTHDGAVVYALSGPRKVTSYTWRIKNSLILRAPTQWAVEATDSLDPPRPWTTIHTLSLNQQDGRYQYIGCFADAADRSMEVGPLDVGALSPQACAEACRDYTYFGLQNGDQCFCGAGYGRYSQESDSACSIQCTGSDAMCGGVYRNSVYLTRSSVNTGVSDACAPTRYEVFQEEFTQAAAEEACIFFGGHLASLHSPADQQLVEEMINRLGIRTAWIGFNDRVAEAGCTDSRHPGIGGSIQADSFTWTDGTLVNYENWARGEPNDWLSGVAMCDGNGQEDCSEMWQNGASWNDINCEQTKPFVCGYCGNDGGGGGRQMPSPGDLSIYVRESTLRGPYRTSCVGTVDPFNLALGATVTGNFPWRGDWSLLVNGLITENEWRRTPSGVVESCSEQLHVTVDLQEEVMISSVSVWHYYADPRRYCGQKVAISLTGEFRGEETVVYNTGLSYGPPETTDGHRIDLGTAAPARFVRHWCSRSTESLEVHFAKLSVQAYAMDELATGQLQAILQPALVFGCIDHWTTQCTHDVNAAAVNGDGYLEALAAFVACADVMPQPAGFCHVELDSASQLSNQRACQSTVSENIGFHTVIPFTVIESGPYHFRFHVDYGLGGYIGIDGTDHHAGDIWGHVLFEDSAMSAGDHYFESLGFEGCCDFGSELEVHIPCDLRSDPWRLVVSGPSASMVSPAASGENCTETYINDGRIQCGETKVGSTSGYAIARNVSEIHSNHILGFSVRDTSVIKFDSCASQFDTLLRVYTADLQTELAICDNCGPCGTADVLDVRLEPGEYALVISGGEDILSAEGAYSVSMQCGSGLHGSIACDDTINGTTTFDGMSLVGQASAEHYYTFTAYATGMYQFNSCGSSFDTFLKIFDRDAKIEIDGCDDCGSCPSSHLASVLTTRLEPGDYILLVEGYGQSYGSYSVDMACRPVSDMLNNSIACGQMVNDTTDWATSMIGNDAGEHVYSFVVSGEESQVVTFDSCRSTFDTFMHIFDTTTMAPIAFSDDDCGRGAILTAMLGPGTYFLVVEGHGSFTGYYEVAMGCQTRSEVSVGRLVCGATQGGDTRDGQNLFDDGASTMNGHPAREHLYEFSLPANATVVVESCDSAFDVHLRVVDANRPTITYPSCESNDMNTTGRSCVAGDVYLPICAAAPQFQTQFSNHRSVIQADLPAGDFLVVVEGDFIEGLYSVTLSCPLEITDPCERAECRSGGICVPTPGNITHPNGDFTCSCPPGSAGPDCRSINTFGEIGTVTLETPNHCITPETPDMNGLTCSMAIGYGYDCYTLINPPYQYDCHCSCNGYSVIGEVNFQTVELTGQYTDPVVVVGIPTAADDDQVMTRVRGVSGTGFEIGLQEPRCLDKTHPPETVGWIVIEAGWHHVGTSAVPNHPPVLIQAGKVSASEVERFDWYPVTYAEAFPSKPAVATSISTMNDGNPVWARMQLSTATGFEVSLQEDDFDGLHLVEEISWIALPLGMGYISDLVYESSFFVGLTHAGNPIAFSRGFTAPPAFFGELTSITACCGEAAHRCDGDPALLRLSATGNTSATMFVDEVTCNNVLAGDGLDWMIGARINDHEELSWLAIEPGQLLKVDLLGCDGVAGSGLQIDSCGVCGGDGTTCVCWSLADFVWDDITNSTSFPGRTKHTLTDDDFVTLPLPFAFQFFGVTHGAGTDYHVFSNGFITFGSMSVFDGSAASYLSQYYTSLGRTAPLPSLGTPGPMIAAYWADLNPMGGGSVYSYADTSRVVVEWAEIPFWNTDITVHFAVVLHTNHTFELRYLDIQPTTPRDAYGRLHAPVSIGWVDASGEEGLQVGYGSKVREVRERIIVPQSCHSVVGCDGVRDSGRVHDRCGLCGGDGAECDGCTDPLAINAQESALFDNGTCTYDCAAQLSVAEQPVWGGPRAFLPSVQHDSTNSLPNITMGGGAFMDRYGLHVDGAGDYAKIDVGLLGGYADDATFTVSFWFTKSDCTSNLYEYMYSHGDVIDGGPLDRSNSNINIFMSCNPQASLLGTSFVRTTLVDKRTRSTDPGLGVLWDWALHDAGDFNSITDVWIAFSLAVTPHSTHTYVDGAPLPTAKYGFHQSWTDCIRNPAYPNPTHLNTAFQGFEFRSDALVGGRTDLDQDRHFWGAIGAVAIYDGAVRPADVSCLFDAEIAGGGITMMPDHYMGCTDPLANNHEPWAGIDDGSCVYGTTGCWDYGPMNSSLGVEWLDVAGQAGATQPHTSQDDEAVVVQLPFALGFPYFGRNYTRVAIADNGYIAFADPGATYFVGETVQAAYQTNRMPSAQWPNNQIAALWTDLAVGDQDFNGAIYTWGNASVFGIEWAQIPHYDSTCLNSGNTGATVNPDGTIAPSCLRLTHFELLLFADGGLQILYKEAPPAPTLYAAVSVGWENQWGTTGVDVRYNDATFPAPMSAVVASPACFELANALPAATGDDSCIFANDGECDDGTWPGFPNFCAGGTDATDCALSMPGGSGAPPSPTPNTPSPTPDATNSCIWAGDGACDDGSLGGQVFCAPGTDTADCSAGGDPGGSGGGNGNGRCPWTDDGECDDGSQGGGMYCATGTDVNDCASGGRRALQQAQDVAPGGERTALQFAPGDGARGEMAYWNERVAKAAREAGAETALRVPLAAV